MEEQQGIRWNQRLTNYNRALDQLDAAVSLANQRLLSTLEQYGVVHCFENTHELGWNVLRDYLKDQGTQQLYGSKDTVREAFAVGLIDDGETWMEMIRTSGTRYGFQKFHRNRKMAVWIKGFEKQGSRYSIQ